MSDSSRKITESINLEKAFNDYRQTEEYKLELHERKKTLQVLGIFEEFADALAVDSLKTGIKISELLNVETEILAENQEIMESTESVKTENDSIGDSVIRFSNNRVYGGTGINI